MNPLSLDMMIMDGGYCSQYEHVGKASVLRGGSFLQAEMLGPDAAPAHSCGWPVVGQAASPQAAAGTAALGFGVAAPAHNIILVCPKPAGSLTDQA